MKSSLIRALFILSGLYDAVLGLGFLVAWSRIFHHFGIVPPNHPGYVQFSALLLIIFGIMFFAIAVNPMANRNLIPFGVLLKFSYTGIVVYYWLSSGVPGIWKPFAIVDVVFAALFLWSYAALCPKAAKETKPVQPAM